MTASSLANRTSISPRNSPSFVSVFCAFIAIVGSLFAASAAEPKKKLFDLAADTADKSLKLFSQQAGLEVLFPHEIAKRVRTQPVKGELSAREALAALLVGTGLIGVEDKTGAFSIRQEGHDPNGARAARPTPSDRPKKNPKTESSDKLSASKQTSLPPPMKSPYLRIFAGLLPALLGLLTATDALGQTSAAPAKTADQVVELDPFTVSTDTAKGYAATNSLSATIVKTSIYDFPGTLNIVTSEFMHDFGLDTVQQALAGVTGVANFQYNVGFAQEQFVIRGFVSSLHLKNGVTYNINTDASFVQQVEVVKGPQTVLYGASDPGGVINIITKQPLSVRRNSATVKYGSYNYLRAEVDSTGPLLASGKLLYRFMASAQKSDSWLKNGRMSQTFLTPVLTWLPWKNTQLTFNYTHQRLDHAWQRPGLPLTSDLSRILVTDRYYSTITPTDQGTVYGDNMDLTLTQRLGERIVVRGFVSGSRNHSDMFNYVGSITPPVITNGSISGWRFTPIDNIEIYDTRARYYQLYANISDIRFASLRHNFVLGFSKEKNDTNTQIIRLPDPAAAFDPLSPPSEIRLGVTRAQLQARQDILQKGQALGNSQGYFIVDQVKTADNRVTILGGVRYDNLGGGVHRTTPQIGGTFEVIKGVNLYGLHSEAYQPNNPRFDAGLGRVVEFPPVESKGLDIGIKVKLLNEKLSGTFSYFDITRTNLVQGNPLLPLPSGAPQFLLSGLEGARGFEAEIFYTPNNAWQFILSYTHLAAKIRESPRATDIGLPLAGASPDEFSVTGKHTFSDGPLKNVSIGALLIHRGGPIAQFGQFQFRNIKQDSWTRVNAFIAYNTKLFGAKTQFNLSVRNLNNAKYLEYINVFNPPRQVFLQTSWNL